MRHFLNLCLRLLPPTRLFCFKRYLANMIGLDVAEGVCLNGHTCFFGQGQISIGRNTWIGLKNTFYCTQLAEIRIGENCDIGPEVSFVPGSHEIGSHDRRAGKGSGGNIVIEDGCWIGARVTILGGVTIAKGAVIGAGALVNKDVPADTIYAGVPAVFKRALNDEESS